MFEIGDFYRRNYIKHLKNINRIVHNNEVAEDIVQEAYARAIQYSEQFDPKRGKFTSWFNKILYNTLRDYKEEHKKRAHYKPCDNVEDAILFHKQSDKFFLVEKEISKISRDKTRKVLTLYFLLGYSSKDIEELTDYSQTNVTTITSRFRSLLIDKYGDSMK